MVNVKKVPSHRVEPTNLEGNNLREPFCSAQKDVAIRSGKLPALPVKQPQAGSLRLRWIGEFDAMSQESSECTRQAVGGARAGMVDGNRDVWSIAEDRVDPGAARSTRADG